MHILFYTFKATREFTKYKTMSFRNSYIEIAKLNKFLVFLYAYNVQFHDFIYFYTDPKVTKREATLLKVFIFGIRQFIHFWLITHFSKST